MVWTDFVVMEFSYPVTQLSICEQWHTFMKQMNNVRVIISNPNAINVTHNVNHVADIVFQWWSSVNIFFN